MLKTDELPIHTKYNRNWKIGFDASKTLPVSRTLAHSLFAWSSGRLSGVGCGSVVGVVEFVVVRCYAEQAQRSDGCRTQWSKALCPRVTASRLRRTDTRFSK